MIGIDRKTTASRALSRRAVLAGLAATPVVVAGSALRLGAATASVRQDGTPVGTAGSASGVARLAPAVPRAVEATLDDLAQARNEIETVGELELVAAIDGPILVGVAVSASGRIFMNFPRWDDAAAYTVAELRDGEVVPFPDEAIQQYSRGGPTSTLFSVQAIRIDPQDRLWLLDTGSVNFGPVVPEGAKLVGIDLESDEIVETIPFPPDVAQNFSSVNDVRFDLRRGEAGVAYVTDASMRGAPGIIVVDLASGRSWRRLNDHPSTEPVPGFVPEVEGEPVLMRQRGTVPRPISFAADGIALNEDGSRLFYAPLASRRLYSVATAALAEDLPPGEAEAAVEELEERPSASDGLEHDAEGRLYLTAYEQNAILRRSPEGDYETLVQNPRMLWPDTMALAADGYLYVTANQLHRQPRYQLGRDLRQRPYPIFRVRVDAEPVRLE